MQKIKAQDLINEATTLQSTGKLDEALEIYTLLLDNMPDNASIICNIGNIHRSKGNQDLALEFLNRAHTIDQSAGYKVNLSNIYKDIGQFNDAKKLLDDALKEKKLTKKYIVLNNLGAINRELGLIKDALDNFKEAILINPDYVPAIINLANLYKDEKTEQYFQAEELYLKVIEKDPNLIAVYAHLMDFYDKTNRLEEMEQVIQTAPDNIRMNDAFRIYESLFLFRRGNYQGANEVLESINCENSTDSRLKQLEGKRLNLLAKTKDKLRDYSQAFELYKKANVYYSQLPKNKYINKKRFKEIVSVRKNFFKDFKIENLDQKLLTHSDEKKVFIIGFPRSGTTLIDSILTSHSLIESIEERPMVVRMIRENAKDLMQIDYFNHLNKESILQGVSAYEKEMNKHINNQNLHIDRHPFNTVYVAEILMHYPNAKFIFMIRNPLDCVLSSYMQYFRLTSATANLIDIEDTASIYSDIMELWEIYQQKFKVDHIVIRYEDIVKDLKSTSLDVLGYLGYEWEENMLSFDENAKTKKINTASYDQVTQPIYNQSVNKWKLYSKELDKVSNILEPWINKLNY